MLRALFFGTAVVFAVSGNVFSDGLMWQELAKVATNAFVSCAAIAFLVRDTLLSSCGNDGFWCDC